MDYKEALKLLWNVDAGVAFHFCNGKSARSLKELLAGIKTLNEEQYQHHVYFDHNDFSNWLFDIIGDDKLGRDLFNAKKKNAIALLKARISYLEEHAKRFKK